MKKISENLIPDINADWGNDASNNLPYSGEAVQEFIKRTLKQKYGYIHYDETQSKYFVFADIESKKLYDEEGDVALILGTFDAPAAYTIEVELQSGIYNSVLSGSTDNLLQFKFVTKKSKTDFPEAYTGFITFTNGGIKKSIPLSYGYEDGAKGVALNIDNYLLDGTNTVTISLKGTTSGVSTTTTAIYNVIKLGLTDTLNISTVYEPGNNLAIPVTVTGTGTKTLQWWVDGEELIFENDVDRITSPGETSIIKIISLEGFEPGVHSVQYRVYTESNGQQFNSPTLFRNFFVAGGDEPLIGLAAELPIGDIETGTTLSKLYGLTQYIPYTLRFAIYNPEPKSSNDIDVFINNKKYITTNAINGVEEQLTIELNDSGDAAIQLKLYDSTYDLVAEVAPSSINISEIPTDVLNLRASGRNNLANQDVWTYTNKKGETITSTFKGFYWNTQSGWNNNTLVINNGAELTIDYAPLSTDWTRSSLGATFEFEFATKNVQNENAPILSLLGDDGQGIIITASEAKMIATGDKRIVSTKFKSGVNNRIVFVINPVKDVSNKKLLFIYVNGVICGAINYEEGDTVRSDSKIVFKGEADIVLKHIRFYDRALTSAQILNNYILYRDEISERLEIYTRNDIRNVQNDIDPDKIKRYLPVMYFTCLGDENANIPWLESQNKSEAKDYKIFCDIEYIDLADETRNFKIKNSRVRLQGTSSIQYPKKNWRFYTAKDKDTVYIDYKGNEYYAPANKDDYGTKKDPRKYAIRPGSIPVDCWCLKTDYAESSSAHNTGTAKFWNDLLTSAEVTYTNVNKSEHYMLCGEKENGEELPIYTFWDQENSKLDKNAIIESGIVSYFYKECSRQEIVNTGLMSHAVIVSSVPEGLNVDSDLFVIESYEHGVVKEHVLRTNAQRLAIENNYDRDVRTAIDGFPIVVFYRLNENSDWIFLGKHNFNNDKSTEAVFGFKDIPGFDDTIIPGSQTESNPEGKTYGEKMQCWELTNNNNELGFFTTVEGWYDVKYNSKGEPIIGWEEAFEARYPDDGSDANTGDLYNFADWISKLYARHLNGEVTNFESEKWDHFDVYKMASYYIYLMRFGAVDQVVKNSMFTSEDGKHFYFIIYDNDTILGVRNDGRLVFDPTIDRQSKDPQSNNDWAYAGHESAIWNLLEADTEFMDIVKAVDDALYGAGLRYNNAINAYEGEQTSKWCEWIYNEDAELKYIGPFKKGFGVDDSGNKVTSYEAGLLSLQGNRNSHRQWWLSQRFNLYDAKFVTGTFKENNIFLKMQGAPKGLEFTITSAANVSHGYEITNGPSEISGLVNIGETQTFTIPQAVSIGDPVVIFGATNIKKLDLSNLTPYMTEISFAKAYSETMGSTIEEINMSGSYNGDGNLKISGLEGMVALRKLDVTGMKSVTSLSLPNSYNIKELYADGTSISSVGLAPGCVIETLVLPNTINRLALKELPLLTIEGLSLANWSKVRELEIENCPKLTSDFDLIWRWYDATRDLSNRRLVLSGVNWKDVNIDRLLTLVKDVTVVFTGTKNEIVLSNIEDKTKLLELEDRFSGISIFNKESYLYIHSTNQIFIFGPEDGIILEGENHQFRTIVFSENPGTYRFILSEKREDLDWDEQTGKLTTTELGLPDLDVQVTVLFIISDSLRFTNSETVTIKKKIYPQNVQIIGKSEISDEPITYTWKSFTTNITGEFSVEWSLVGNIDQYISIINSGTNSCTLEMHTPPETVARGTLQLTLTKWNGTVLETPTFNLLIRNPEVVMTTETNPEVLNVLWQYCSHRMSDSTYLLRSEAESFIDDDFVIDKQTAIFKNSNIRFFNEFKDFTGIKTVPNYCFDGCRDLLEVTLPSSITAIKDDAFRSTKLTSIVIPENVKTISQSAFESASSITSFTVHTGNPNFGSHGGAIYSDVQCLTLYIIAPGITEFKVADATIAVYGDGSNAWQSGRSLKKIILNDKIQGISGVWFKSAFLSQIQEVTGPDREDYKFYNGCIYNGDYSTLIYWPAGKTYSEDLLKFDEDGNCTINRIGTRAFNSRKIPGIFSVPSSVIQIDEWAFYGLDTNTLNIHENVHLGNYCFHSSKISNLNVETIHFDGVSIFNSCTGFTSVELPEGLKSIPDGTFSGNSLITMTLPDSIETIGTEAFTNNKNLVSFVIPEKVKSIGRSCFRGCLQLGDITSLAPTAPTLAESVFGETSVNYTGINATTKTLTVPSNTTGYTRGDWQSVLQDKIGFTLKSIT